MRISVACVGLSDIKVGLNCILECGIQSQRTVFGGLLRRRAQPSANGRLPGTVSAVPPIAGGRDAEVNAWPWMVREDGIHSKKDTYFLY